MQTLYFEEAWNRTIAPEDRNKIRTHFREIQQKEAITFSFLWQATNYKNETLITALIHNPKQTPLKIEQTPIAYEQKNHIRQTSRFNLPLSIPSETSMPWTFIFSKQNKTEEQPLFIIK